MPMRRRHLARKNQLKSRVKRSGDTRFPGQPRILKDEDTAFCLLRGDEPSRLHDTNPVAKRKCLAYVVSHQERRGPQVPLEPREFAAHFRARDRIERAERFVHQQNWRIDRECSCQAHALPLATGEFTGTPGGGYLMLTSDGGVDAFNAPCYGSLVWPVPTGQSVTGITGE